MPLFSNLTCFDALKCKQAEYATAPPIGVVVNLTPCVSTLIEAVDVANGCAPRIEICTITNKWCVWSWKATEELPSPNIFRLVQMYCSMCINRRYWSAHFLNCCTNDASQAPAAIHQVLSRHNTPIWQGQVVHLSLYLKWNEWIDLDRYAFLQTAILIGASDRWISCGQKWLFYQHLQARPKK